MSQFDCRTPKNLVANIIDKEIVIENMSDQMVETVKGMGAFRMAYGTELIWLIKCVDDDELIQKLQELNLLGFLFEGAPAGYPAADVFALVLEKKELSAEFKEIRWRGPGDWYIIQR